MKYLSILLLFAGTFGYSQNTSIQVNPNGTHSVIHNHGNISTQANPDGTFTNTHHHGATSTQFNPDGTITTIHHNNAPNSITSNTIPPNTHTYNQSTSVNKPFNHPEESAVHAVCMNYIEGFYEGDTTKLINALRPSLYKFGFWKSKKTKSFEKVPAMSFQDAKNYAKELKSTKDFAEDGDPKGVEIFDILDYTACAKITAWWGHDFILLSKDEGTWKIEQVIWEGPLKKK